MRRVVDMILFYICAISFAVFVFFPLFLLYILKGEINKKDLKKIYKILFK